MRAAQRVAGDLSESGSDVYEGLIQNLIDELGRFPGVGPKGAQRIAFHLLAADPEEARSSRPRSWRSRSG